MTSFYFNKDFSFHMFFNSDIIKAVTAQKKFQICSAIEIAKIMNRIFSVACDNLIKAQGDMIKQANCQCHMKNFAVGDEVMINIQNLVSDQLTKALNNKRCESFRILQQFHFFYKLDILSKWYATDIFHVSNLTKATDPR